MKSDQAMFEELIAIMKRLRGPGGCPWDAEQTHESLTRYLLEETYEVIEAIEAKIPRAHQGRAGRPSAPAGLSCRHRRRGRHVHHERYHHHPV